MKKGTADILKRVGWVGLCIAGLCVLFASLSGLANRPLRRAYAALEADGRPMDPAQIIPPPIPDADNAAPIYQAAALQLKTEPGGEELGALAARMLEDESDAEAEEAFRALCARPFVQDAIEMLRKGSRRAGCRYDIDYSMGWETLLPHIGELRNLSRIICGKARLSVAQGLQEEAWDDAITSLRLANALQNEPALISQLVRMAQFSLAVNAIRFVAARGAPNPQQYDETTRLLLTFEDIAPLVLALDGERLMLGEWAFDQPPSELKKIFGDEQSIPVAFYSYFPPLRQHDRAAYLSTMHAYANNAIAPYSPCDTDLDEQLLNDVPRHFMLTRLLAPPLSAVKGRFVIMIAQARVTRVGLAAIRFKQDQGAFPPDLQALELADTDDPFTGKPLIYRATDHDFTIYSVGKNLSDNGGTESKDPRSGDIVWRFEKHTQAGQL